MGRPEDQVWQLVNRDADGKHWLCLHCGKSYAGSASRVKFHLAKIPFQGIAICERVPQEFQGKAYELIPARVREKIAVAGEQHLDNAVIQGVHNPTAGQNHPGEVPEVPYYEWLRIQGVHNPTAGQNHPDEVSHHEWLEIQDVHNPNAGQNHPGEEPDYEWFNDLLESNEQFM